MPRRFDRPPVLPPVTVVEVSGIDIDGDLFARPEKWDESRHGAPPRIEIVPGEKGHPALAVGDRALVRLSAMERGEGYEASVLRRIDAPSGRIIGLVRLNDRGGILVPANKKERGDFDIAPGDLNGAKTGDYAVGEVIPTRGLNRKKIRIVSVIGRKTDIGAISLLSLYEAGLKPDFPAEVLAAAEGLSVPPLGDREDLRGVPLVTIDGADARDFDDAVFAEETPGGGFHLIVAIADVSWYVRPESPLDAEAFRRGNSTYFPDRVVPMLPEALSNGLCSLVPKEDRACLAAHLWIDAEGALARYKIVRGLMRSAARLTYEQAQAARDGSPDSVTEPLMRSVIAPLYAAYEVLWQARRQRGALDLDLPERKIEIDQTGKMVGVKPRARLDSHKLIEEFMILANVAAAQTLEGKKAPCAWRIHDAPAADRISSAAEFLDTFGLSLPKGQRVTPGQLNLILEKARSHPYSHLVSEVILRSQAQAHYSPENIGHFGLALKKYAHFTSPIRRYADLIVHRSLVRALGLGSGGLDEGEAARIEEICMHISDTERVSMGAERNAVDRFTAAFLADRIGSEFSGRIQGVTRFGLFVALDETGADGLVPIRSLPDDFYIHDEKRHALIGRRSRRVYRLGASVKVRLREADGLTGGTIFEMVGTSGADLTGFEIPPGSAPGSGSPRRGRPGGDRRSRRNPSRSSQEKGPEKRPEQARSGKKGGGEPWRGGGKKRGGGKGKQRRS